MKVNKWTEEVIQFMIENYEGKDNIELAKLLNEKFNLNTNNDRVSNVKANLKRRRGIDLTTHINNGCYKKGNIPVNKGTKGMFNVGGNSGSFKKGNIPPNRREVGSERLSKNGYIEIKIQDGHLNKNWMMKHRYIYEQHYGPIPKGYKVIFLDGNIRNFDINNLKAISSHEELIMNEYGLRYGKKEFTESASIVAQLELKRRELKNERL